MRLLNEGLISADADLAALSLPVHGERVEYLLTVIACALTRLRADQVAPWTRKTCTFEDVLRAQRG